MLSKTGTVKAVRLYGNQDVRVEQIPTSNISLMEGEVRIASMTVLAKLCYDLPPLVSFELGALVEPLAVAWNGVAASRIKAGEKALVIGTGPIGMATVCCLKAIGIERIVVSGRSVPRNEHMAKWGVEAVLNSSSESVAAMTKETFDG
jgi:(R,R)-butanediol dehydrogenase / meso-butanediol dehydrogenase / diacetyl reductase